MSRYTLRRFSIVIFVWENLNLLDMTKAERKAYRSLIQTFDKDQPEVKGFLAVFPA